MIRSRERPYGDPEKAARKLLKIATPEAVNRRNRIAEITVSQSPETHLCLSVATTSASLICR